MAQGAGQLEAEAAIESMASLLGDRWSDAWLEWKPMRLLHVGVVSPSADDVVRLAELGQTAGWPVAVVAHRYSARQIEEFAARLDEHIVPRDSHVIAWGRRPERNKVFVEMSAPDLELLTQLYSSIPGDALIVSVVPGVRVKPA